jgi:hypothetical protein
MDVAVKSSHTSVALTAVLNLQLFRDRRCRLVACSNHHQSNPIDAALMKDEISVGRHCHVPDATNDITATANGTRRDASMVAPPIDLRVTVFGLAYQGFVGSRAFDLHHVGVAASLPWPPRVHSDRFRAISFAALSGPRFAHFAASPRAVRA